MSDNELAKAFGEDFADEFTSEVNRRRQERQRVNEDTLQKIAQAAINNNEFDADNPLFDYKSDTGVTHNVALMKVPDPDGRTIFSYSNDLDSGACTMPLEYMGEWMSCLFNDREMAKQLEEGRYYIVVGNMDTWERDNGEIEDQMSPVRGIIPLDKAKEYADGKLEEEGFGSDDEEEASEFDTDDDEEVEEESTEDESSDDDEDGSIFGDDGEEEEEEDDGLPSSEIESAIEDLAEDEPAVWEIERGDSRHEKLSKVVANQLELNDIEAVAEEVWSVVEAHEDDDDEDEEESLFST